MPIYKIELNVPESKYKQDIVNALPALSLTIGSEVKLSRIGLMQFVRLVTRECVESIQGLSISAHENQTSWNAYIDQGKLSVLEMDVLGEVDLPDQWHSVADPIKTIGFIRLLPYEDNIVENAKHFYFDWQLPNIYLEESTDYDHDIEASGTVILDNNTGALEFSFMDMCKEVACLAEFPKVQVCFQNMIAMKNYEYDGV